MTLPPVLKYLKNEIASIYPWLFLLDITLPNSALLHFVHNNEDITIPTTGVTYTKFPFQIELPEIDSDGNIPTWNIRVDNTLRIFETYLQQTKGAVGSEIILTIINAQYLSESYVDLQTKIEILDTSSDENWVVFACGGRNLFRDIYPVYRYLANHCMWRFKWHECYYNDPSATVVYGDDGNIYICIQDHLSAAANKPVTGATWWKYWRLASRKNISGRSPAGSLSSTISTWQEGASYTAGSETCRNTFTDCRAKNNTRRYGAFIGLSQKGIKVV
jgi:phage-related protein